MQRHHRRIFLTAPIVLLWTASISLAQPEDFEIDAAPVATGTGTASTSSPSSAAPALPSAPPSAPTTPPSAPPSSSGPPSAAPHDQAESDADAQLSAGVTASARPFDATVGEEEAGQGDAAASAHDSGKGDAAASDQDPGGDEPFERSVHSRPVPRGLELSGFLQAQYLLSDLSEDQLGQDGAPLNQDEFSLRRARVRVESGYEFSAFAAELEATTLGGASVKLRRGEGSVFYRGEGGDESAPLIGLTAGVTDIPFGYELVESTRTRRFMERTLGSSALFPTQMDVGAKLWGGYRFIRYAAGFVNGQPLDSRAFERDPNARKELVGRLGVDVRAGDALVIEGGTSFAFGKGFHAGRPATKDSLSWRDDNEDGIAAANEVVGVPGSAARPSSSFARWAVGLDLRPRFVTPLGTTTLLAEAILASNHDRGLFASDPVERGFDLRQTALSAGVLQQLSPYGLIGFRVAYYDPNRDLFEQRRGAFTPRSLDVLELSPLISVVLPGRASLSAQYDFISDYYALDLLGVPVDADNDQLTLRLQVEL